MIRSINTLIVDDHDGMRTTLQDILEDEGYNVKLASSGFEAIDFCKKNQFDFILMDVKMPGINGIDTFKKIKSITTKPRVIMMSAYSADNLKMEALKEGAIAYLQKPLDVSKVLHILDETEFTPALIVTKDSDSRENILNILKDKRFYSHVTHSPDEAIQLAKYNNFGLILIDTLLETISGLDLYLALKQFAANAIIIMITDIEESLIALAKEAIRKGAYTFLEKPIQKNELEGLLSEVKNKYSKS